MFTSKSRTLYEPKIEAEDKSSIFCFLRGSRCKRSLVTVVVKFLLILNKMFFFCILIPLFISIGSAEGGELIIAQSPLSVKFEKDGPIDQHLIPEIFSAAMGFTPQQESDWRGMTISDPFNFAEAVVVLYVDGIPTLGKYINLHKYTVNNNEDEFITWKNIKNKISDRYPLENNTLLKIELGHFDEKIDSIKTKHLSKNIAEDIEFLKELVGLNEFIRSEKKFDGVPDLYWLSMKSLHVLSDMKGLHHASTVEAKEMVYQSLLKLATVFDAVYQNQVLVVALMSDASHTRRVRSAVSERTDDSNDTQDVRDNIYDPDFPVLFNIILWFTLALFFSLLAVSVFIASMDPGRDSIIYRMTSNRMKKDS